MTSNWIFYLELTLILTDSNNRVILWGCKVGNGVITADLAYFAPNLFNRQITLYPYKAKATANEGRRMKAQRRSGSPHVGRSSFTPLPSALCPLPSYTVALPSNVLRQDFPSKSQQISFNLNSI